ncbi:MAG: flagellar hook-associated protein FlgK, partial [Synergistales bacterium]|nr:flagellar hook-associated protein FlgK [Synergistales bacterium]
ELIDCKPSDICDETDGEFKVYLDSKLLVQGRETRHLVTVPVQGNQGFLDVQIEDNEFDHVSDPNVMEVIVEQGAAEAVHQVGVRRLASETAWKVGNGNDKLDVTDSSEALGVKGNFRLQVDSSGVRKTSRTIKDGEILSGAPAADQPQEYQFRIQAGDVDSLISVAWDDGTTNWQISDNLGNGPYPAGPPAGADPLTLSDLAGFINDNSATYENIEAETNNNKLTISSSDDHIISLADSKNNLLSGKLNMQNGGTIYTVEVTEEDTLETIRNKINGLYAPHYCEDGFEEAQDWLHANIADDGTGSMYLTLESNAVGEANRINVLGDDGGSLYVAKKLGLVHVDDTETVEGETSFMETSRDALFTVDSDKYLSATNSFREARKITAEDAYQASEMQEVLEGVHFTLKETGSSGLTVKHHVNGGEISAIMEARDDVILDHIGTFDEIAYQLSLQMNAVHYAGHGTGDHAMSTGVAFFNPIAAEYGASRALEINSLLDEDTSYIGTASDDGDGYTLGEGDGSNALRMAQLKQADILESGSSSFSEFYESFIAELGSEGQTARTMADNQRHLVEQIENQRQSIMGVSIDEEMMDITQFQQAFNAMARFITVQDELLDKMINGMGIVGR